MRTPKGPFSWCIPTSNSESAWGIAWIGSCLALLIFATFIQGCSPPSSDEKWVRPIHRTKITPPPPEVEVKQDAVGVTSPLQKFDPKVDILFVIDNSSSMDKHQKDLVVNIEKFVSKFSSNKIVDYHIGVLATWDTFTFETEAYRQAFPNKLKKGQLQPLRYVATGTVEDRGVILATCPPFVQRNNPCFSTDPTASSISKLRRNDSDAVSNVLKSTLFIGVDKFEGDLSKIAPGTDSYHRGGPQFEELFTPLQGFIDQHSSGNTAAAEFLRPEAPLVVILITDADESSTIAPEEMAAKLLALKGGDPEKVNVLSVLVSKNDPDELKDPGIRVTTTQKSTHMGEPLILGKFSELFEASGHGRRLGINNKDYGTMLAQMGDFVNEKVMRKVIPLDARPEWGSIEVTYGKQTIQADSRKGWTYDAESNSIILNPGISFSYQEGAQIQIKYVPINLEDVSKGKLRRVN